MSIAIEEAEALVTVHFRVTPSARKYDSPANRQAITDRVRSYGIVPSPTGVLRAIQELVAAGTVARTDGGSESTDRAAAATAEQARISRIANATLTETDFNLYVRMHPDELAQRYYAEKEFAARYDRACQAWGFRKPGPSPKSIVSDAADVDTPVEGRLTAKQYNLMPAAEVRRRYKDPSQPQFRKDVDRLLARGEI